MFKTFKKRLSTLQYTLAPIKYKRTEALKQDPPSKLLYYFQG